MGWMRTIGLALLGTMASLTSLAGLASPASAQSTPSPAVKKLIEARLAEFDALTKEVDAAGTDEAKLAELALAQNRLDDAAQYTEELLKTRDGQVVGRYFRGRVALAHNQMDKAIPAFQAVIKEAPNYERAHYYLGVAYQRRQNMQLAKTAFTMAMAGAIPLLPLTIVGTHEAWPAGKLWVLGGDVKAVIHPPIETAGMEKADTTKLAARTRDIIASAL